LTFFRPRLFQQTADRINAVPTYVVLAADPAAELQRSSARSATWSNHTAEVAPSAWRLREPCRVSLAGQRGERSDRIGDTIDIGAFEAHIGTATSFQVDAPATVLAGTPFDLTVIALDGYNQVATGYAGRVKITTSDPGEGNFLSPTTRSRQKMTAFIHSQME